MTSMHVGNIYYVSPGQPAFNFMSNLCGAFQLGEPAGDDVWLQGDIVGEDWDFIFNGRLFLPNGAEGTVIDNFPKSTPPGWTRRPVMDGEGYDLVDDDGEIIFGYRVHIAPNGARVCAVTVNLYRKDGTLAAHGGQNALVTHDMPLGFRPATASLQS